MVEIEIDGKQRRIVFNYNAVSDAETAAGRGFASMCSEQQVGFNTIRILLWAGLKTHDPGLTLQRTGQLIDKYVDDGGDVEEVTNIVFKAVQESKLFAKQFNSGNAEAGGE